MYTHYTSTADTRDQTHIHTQQEKAGVLRLRHTIVTIVEHPAATVTDNVFKYNIYVSILREHVVDKPSISEI